MLLAMHQLGLMMLGCLTLLKCLVKYDVKGISAAIPRFKRGDGRNTTGNDRRHSILLICLAVESFLREQRSKEALFQCKIVLSKSSHVTENVYGMLKGRWRLIFKKCESKMHNVKYVIMACVLLHNLYIARQDPCNQR